ncbi:MAG: hypothetical protein V3T77_07385 [Planctomycetota bacterium]
MAEVKYQMQKMWDALKDTDVGEESSGMIRRGLLYMLLAAVLFYFAGGYNPMEFPLNVIPPVLDIFLPLLFLGGLGMVLLAVIRRPRSALAEVRS